MIVKNNRKVPVYATVLRYRVKISNSCLYQVENDNFYTTAQNEGRNRSEKRSGGRFMYVCEFFIPQKNVVLPQGSSVF